ncbi:MAG: oligosaccharide flippase family protein [Bacilli bacterium]|nr:oligosaccharide flippase family protein [Bacilli bacterium]
MNAKAARGNNIRVNVVINLIRTLAMTALSFITFPYVTRALGDQAFGLYTWANTFVYYFLVLAKISIPNIAIVECAKVRDDKEALSKKAQEFFILQAITTLISFAFELGLCFAIPALRENNGLIFLLSVNFLVGTFSFEWIYIALEKHIYITVRSIVAIALAALLTYIRIRPAASYYSALNEIYLYAFFTILPTIITAVVNCIVLPQHISFKKTQKYDFLPILRKIPVLFFISLFVTVYNQTDSFILGFLDPGKAAVGAYSVGVKGIDIVITLVTSLYTVFMPRATHYFGMEDKRFYNNLLRYSMNITLFIAIPAIATMATMSSPIVTLVSGENGYENAHWVLTILASMMVTFSISDNIYTQILLPQKKEATYLIAMTAGVILNIGLSLLLGIYAFPSSPVLGVAIATMATDVALVAYLLFATRQYSFKAVFNLNSLKILLVGIAIGVISYFLYPLLFGAMPFEGDSLWLAKLLSLLSVIAVDAIVYVGVLLLLREKLVSSFLPSSRARREKENAQSESEGK